MAYTQFTKHIVQNQKYLSKKKSIMQPVGKMETQLNINCAPDMQLSVKIIFFKTESNMKIMVLFKVYYYRYVAHLPTHVLGIDGNII